MKVLQNGDDLVAKMKKMEARVCAKDEGEEREG
jgi:hypothetical protein